VRQLRSRVEAAVARAVAEGVLWPARATLVVGVSGGADSLCLLGTLLALRDSGAALAPGRVVVAHLDHGMRGMAGADDARWVATLSEALGVEAVVERVDVPALARAEHRSPEDSARRARYAFLRRVARQVGADRICVGHTRDDQVETLLLHWLRGSGLAGLAGMAPLEGEVARPLLTLTRAETAGYCAARGWIPREDPTNADFAHLRNRVRHELLPLLERYNRGLRETLVRNAAVLRDDARALDELAGALWSRAVTPAGTETLRLDAAALREALPALRRRVLRRAAIQLVGHERAPEARHLRLLERLLDEGRSGDQLDLPGELRASLEYGVLVLTRAAQGPALAGDETVWSLPVPGVLALRELGWRLRAWIEEAPPEPPAGRAEVWRDLESGFRLPELIAYVDAEVAGTALTVRTWRPGDRMRPLGMRGEKKLQDLFADAHVPRGWRHRLPLICAGAQLLWVAGLRLDERARVTPRTTRVLALRLEPFGVDDTRRRE
jgi:tRNA(Ile)-lysidine synthase